MLFRSGFKLFKKQPIFGYGGFFMEGRSSIGNSKLYPVHTPYIQILVDGGLFLFFQFIYIVFDTFRKL